MNKQIIDINNVSDAIGVQYWFFFALHLQKSHMLIKFNDNHNSIHPKKHKAFW